MHTVQNRTYDVRTQKAMLYVDVVEPHQVQTKVLNQAIKRNTDRFLIDLKFRVTVADREVMPSQIVTAFRRKRYVSVAPSALIKQGLQRLSGTPIFDKAIRVKTATINAFLCSSQRALSGNEFSEKLKELGTKYNRHRGDIGETLNDLQQTDKQAKTFRKVVQNRLINRSR